MQSSTCQHVATLQFVSSAETDSAYSGQHPCFGTNLSSFATHGDEYDLICLIVICVSLWLRKQRRAEKDSLCGQGHDGLNLTCLDQCHGVRSWHKFLPRLTQKNCFLYSLPSKFDP